MESIYIPTNQQQNNNPENTQYTISPQQKKQTLTRGEVTYQGSQYGQNCYYQKRGKK